MIKQHPPHELNVARQQVLDQRSSGRCDRHDDAALVFDRWRAPDEPRLLQLIDLVGEPAAAVDDAIGQVGHALLAGRRSGEPRQDLELHVTDSTVDTQVLLDGMLEQTADLHEREVGS